MRFLPALLLIAAPLLAQEPTEEQRRAELDALERLRAENARLAAEKAAYDKRAEELRREADERSRWGMTGEDLKRLLEELRSKTDERRAEAMEELKRVDANLEDMLPFIAEVLARTERLRTAVDFAVGNSVAPRTLVVGARGGEAIAGAADGTEYTLKSLGSGKYQLSATKIDGDGRVMERIDDQGTMAELQGKYAFLKDLAAVQLRAPAVAAAPVAVQWAADPKGRFWTANAGFAQYGQWDGGGKVGVSVCPPSEDLRFHLQLPEGAGYIVQHVVPGSRAEQIGIRRMDILLRLDAELIDSPVQLKKLHEKAGMLEILRRSEAKKIDLSTFPEWKAPEAPEAPQVVDVPAAPAGAGGGGVR